MNDNEPDIVLIAKLLRAMHRYSTALRFWNDNRDDVAVIAATFIVATEAEEAAAACGIDLSGDWYREGYTLIEANQSRLAFFGATPEGDHAASVH